MNDPRTVRILRLREGANVQRCHTIPHVGEYAVGQHTFGMLVLLEALHPSPTIALYRAVLYHDLHERWIGDMPGHIVSTARQLHTAKRRAEKDVNEKFGLEGPVLSEDEERWLHALDKIEFLMWCHDQLNMGNDHVSAALESTDEWIADHRDKLPAPCREFVEKFEWERTDWR